ncbi:unnamed protein product [Sphenostylis stenocarpa]|uniref:Uncharacterized protein n=1 Tax=Sphenostylis stenocarpa TaxID=92480 RepID=A0AA86VWD0_9FABA|nr:unnamed protein product [Sphenostylis stenocarpa]
MGQQTRPGIRAQLTLTSAPLRPNQDAHWTVPYQTYLGGPRFPPNPSFGVILLPPLNCALATRLDAGLKKQMKILERSVWLQVFVFNCAKLIIALLFCLIAAWKLMGLVLSYAEKGSESFKQIEERKMALVSGGRSTLNPNAPLYIPAAFRQVEDFSPEWWQLVTTFTWYHDFWLSQQQEDGAYYGEEDEFDGNDVVDLLPESFDLDAGEDLDVLDAQLEDFIQSYETQGTGPKVTA